MSNTFSKYRGERYELVDSAVQSSKVPDPEMKCLYSIQFLAPTGAQEMLMFVLMAKVCLIEQSIFIFLGQRSLRKQSGSSR